MNTETVKHIFQVQTYISLIINQLHNRLLRHDKSKLESPEVEAFNSVTQSLKNLTYGSQEYKEILQSIQPAIDHHYQNNSHHPEFYKNGISGMTLIDLIEMICDWKAATLRHTNGDIYRSIEINQKRFGYSDELKSIFINTVKGFDNEST